MPTLIQHIRAFLRKIFFWHSGETRSNEFTPEPGHDHALVLQVTSTPSVPRWRQLRYAGKVLSVRERRILLAMALVCAAALLAAGWFTVQSKFLTVSAPGGRVVEAVIGAPKYPHPFYAATNDPDQDLVSLVYAGLFRRSGNDVVPDLAEKFEWTEDGKRLNVTLRNDARFHDGWPVTADDVVFTLLAAKDAAWRSAFVNTLRNVNVERIDDQTVAIMLDHADVNILDTLTMGILPAHIWQDVPPGSAHLADANVRPVGAGPFRIRSFTRDARGAIIAYTLERNDQYHGIKPYLQQLELRFFPDQATAQEALRGGQVDTLAFVPGPDTKTLTEHNRLEASTIELPQETIAFFNVNDPLLKDTKIRQALSLAVDRQDVVQAQAGLASPVNGPFPFLETDAPTSTIEQRLDQARGLLDSAGWIIPADGTLRIKKSNATSTAASSTVLEITITVPDVPDLIGVAEALRRRWALLGAKTEMTVEPAEMLARRIMTDRNAQILVWNVLLSPSQDQRPVWWSGEATGRGLNLSNLSDRNVDDTLDAIRAATTTEGLLKARQNFSQAVQARWPAVFLTRPGYGYVHNSRVKGMSEQLQLGKPSDRFNDVTNWYVKTAFSWK